MFGKRATEKRVKEFLKDYLKSTAYQEKLTETLAASDSEVSAYYEDLSLIHISEPTRH